MTYDSERFDCGLVFEQNGNPVPNWVDPLALIALQAFLAAEDERLAAHGTDQDFEQVRRNHRGKLYRSYQLSAFGRRHLAVSF